MELIVQGQNGVPKFWLDPGVELGQNVGLSQYAISTILRLVEEHENEIRTAWKQHFPG